MILLLWLSVTIVKHIYIRTTTSSSDLSFGFSFPETSSRRATTPELSKLPVTSAKPNCAKLRAVSSTTDYDNAYQTYRYDTYEEWRGEAGVSRRRGQGCDLLAWSTLENSSLPSKELPSLGTGMVTHPTQSGTIGATSLRVFLLHRLPVV